MRLKNKVALVTGIGTKRGIGHSAALTLAREGAKIIGQDLNLEGAKSTVSEIQNQGGEAVAIGGGVENYTDMCKAVRKAVETFGTIDILVHVAGITQAKNILDVTTEEWNHIINVDLTGTFNAVKAVIPWMVKKQYGKIVTISSVSAKQGGGIFGGVHYCAAKAGVLGLTKNVAITVAQYGICVNSICPGFIDTDIVKGYMTDEVRQRIKEGIPQGRFGVPQDIANAVLFLASDESAHITGEVMDVNGGSYID